MALTINNFHKGQSTTPYTTDGAFAKSQNLDVFSQPGIARINYLPVKLSASTGDHAVGSLPISFTHSPESEYVFYFACIDNNVYKAAASGSTITKVSVAARGKYIAVWKGFLIAAYGTKVWAMNLSTEVWTELDTALSAGNSRYMIVSKNDGNLYICNQSNIASLVEDTTFDPTNAATYTLNPSHFSIPAGYVASALKEQRENIIISASNEFASYPKTETTFFIYDRERNELDYPITIQEERMSNLLGVGGNTFITGGMRGNIYSLSESGLVPYAKIPFDYDNNKNIEIGTDDTSSFPYLSMANWKDRLLVGVSSEDGLYPAGLYGIKDGTVVHEFLPSEGYDGSTKHIRIGGIYPFSNNILVYGWKNVTDGTYGLDKITTDANRQVSYTSYFESIFYPVGTKLNKTSFSRIEVLLSRALQTGEGVRIKYRKNIDDSWTTLQTKDYATDGAVSVLDFAGIHNLINLQLRVELTTGASSKNTPYGMSVICHN